MRYDEALQTFANLTNLIVSLNNARALKIPTTQAALI